MALTGHPTAIAWGYVIAFNLVILRGRQALAGGRNRLQRHSAAQRPDRAERLLPRMRPLFIQPFADQGNILLERFIGSTLAVGSLCVARLCAHGRRDGDLSA